MLKNYFKIAIAVLKRRKFFTFISLFGISLTLAILIVVAALFDHILGPSYPDTNRDRELFVNSLRLRSTDNNSSVNGGPSFYFLNEYVSKLKTQEKLAILSNNNSTTSFSPNKRFLLALKYTNDQFWDVLQCQFIEGKPYTKQQIDNAEKVAVITETVRNSYFGDGVQSIGKYIETDNVQYRVIGVIKDIPQSQKFAFADIFVPYTLTKADLRSHDLSGDYTGILLLHSKSDVPKMKEEFAAMAAKVPMNKKDNLNLLFTSADTFFETFTNGFSHDSNKAGKATFFLITSLLTIIFLSLPTLNLININISRILDRSSEIGMRKAFGASSKTLVYQFLVENLILTFIGGIIGIIFSTVFIQILNASQLVRGMHLSMSLNVFFVSFLACLFFGVLSGVYPAWRMSKLHVVTALKAQ